MRAKVTKRIQNKVLLTGVLGLICAAFESPAQASSIVSNGTFTSYTGTFGTAGGGLNTGSDYSTGGSLTGWTVADVNGSQGLALLYFAGNQGNTSTAGDGVVVNGRFGGFSMYDPGNVAGATPSGGSIPNTSPGGGNFIVADGASGYDVAIYTALTSLSAGTSYAVSFWYAAGQQYNYNGNTTEGWQVSLENSAQTTQVTANGTTIQDTPNQANIPGTSTPGLASGGFQAWAQETFYFTASSSSQVLTFLSLGTPAGQPPVALLSDVTMVQATPEPVSITTCGAGLAALAGFLWFRRRKAENPI